MNAIPNFPLESFFDTSPLAASTLFPVTLFLDFVFFSVKACKGVARNSFNKESTSDRSPPPTPLRLEFSPSLSSLLPARLLRFFDCAAPFPSNDDADESSSSGGRVSRSNISGGNTAPRDKIRFPPLFFFVCNDDLDEVVVVVVIFVGRTVAAFAVAGGIFGFAFVSSFFDDDEDEEDDESSLPYPFNRSMVEAIVFCTVGCVYCEDGR
mmetsp:Transcript_32702/g.69063  ORF Transcript_32702/g.69063 Transcript_32702/m.69063 type:complete len:209 (-) Transcript_32702:62-688(-)